ncbi:MAG: 2-C-methyl-D-erythritol 4-phosphate cytidylyltransferase [Pseudomonadota bacterium]
MSNKSMPKFWGIIPAAGVGKRMQLSTPKQYLKFNNNFVVHHALKRLMTHPSIQNVVVALSKDDEYWHQPSEVTALTCEGGAERVDSVLAAARFLLNETQCQESDWVLVHDAARPFVSLQDIQTLVQTAIQLTEPMQGCILAVPCRDTMKWSDSSGWIQKTVDRSHLWHAQTPQCFRIGELVTAILAAQAANHHMTDEASAIEFTGGSIKLVIGSTSNLKITFPEDIDIAEFMFEQQKMLSAD